MRIALLALCLAACTPDAPAPQPPQATVPAADSAPAPSPPTRADIKGEWRLSKMNGRPASASLGEARVPDPITMSVGDFTFRARSQCVAFWRRYEWSQGRLVVTSANPGAMCARGLSQWETEFSRTLSAVTDADVRNGALHLSGLDASLTFQSAPPLPRERFTGRWRLRFLHGASPPAGENPIEITVTEDTINASACIFSGWRYRQDGNLLEVTPVQSSVCERMPTETEARFGRFMDGLNRATIIQGGALILDSAAEQLEFRRVE